MINRKASNNVKPGCDFQSEPYPVTYPVFLSIPEADVALHVFSLVFTPDAAIDYSLMLKNFL